MDANAEAAEHAVVDAHEPRGVPSAVKAIPAPTEDTASVELASPAKGAVTAKPEALEPWAGGEAGHERDTVLGEAAAAGA